MPRSGEVVLSPPLRTATVHSPSLGPPVSEEIRGAMMCGRNGRESIGCHMMGEKGRFISQQRRTAVASERDRETGILYREQWRWTLTVSIIRNGRKQRLLVVM